MDGPKPSDDTAGQPSRVEGAEKHLRFDLWLHDTDSLADALGEPVLGRRTLHEWPLSCVQRIDCESGPLIYKTQRMPTVEPAFYRAAASPLLPECRDLGEICGCPTLILELIDGEPISDRSPTAPELLALNARLQKEIDRIEGDLPVYANLGSEDAWRSFVDRTLGTVSELVQRSVFRRIPEDATTRVSDWACSPAVLELVETQPAFLHGDPNGGNIFVVGDELRLVDWQRPRIAPRAVDTAGLLLWNGRDPYPHVQREAVQIFLFLVLEWFVACQAEFIPAVRYEAQVLNLLSELL